MRYDLRAMALRQRPALRRRGSITLRDTPPPAVLATDLFQSAYRPILTLWQSRIPAILAEYERTLWAMTTDSPADVQAQIDAVEAGFTRIFLTLTAGVRAWAIKVETWQRGRWRGAILSATGVDVGTLIGPEDMRTTIEATIARNVGLVKDVQAQAAGRITDAVFRGLNQRLPAVAVARDIQAAMAMSRRRAINIASDQLGKISTSLAEERQREAGVDQVEWVHSGKLHPRANHKARNGVIYDLATKRPVAGGEAVAPGDWVGQPPFCGCRSRAHIDFGDN